jgi:hypothetical protein
LRDSEGKGRALLAISQQVGRWGLLPGEGVGESGGGGEGREKEEEKKRRRRRRKRTCSREEDQKKTD